MSKYHFRLSWCMSWEPGVERIGKTVQEQLINWIAYEYNLGNYPDNFLMPSVRCLSAAFKVKRHLIERAYQFWIKREEILYTRDRVGTFMFDPAISYPGIMVASLAGFQFGKKSALFSSVREEESMNYLTLGSSYPVPCIDVLDLRSADRSGNRVSGKDKQVSWSFIDAFKVLSKRKLVNNERQFCNIPDGQAISKVLKKMTARGDLLVMTSADDSVLVETARELRLNVEFSGSDEQGMSAIRLEQICERSIVKAILVRPEPNFPIPVRMTEARWNQILTLAKRYEFGIIVWDEDYEFRTYEKEVLIWPKGEFSYSPATGFFGEAEKLLLKEKGGREKLALEITNAHSSAEEKGLLAEPKFDWILWLLIAVLVIYHLNFIKYGNFKKLRAWNVLREDWVQGLLR